MSIFTSIASKRFPSNSFDTGNEVKMTCKGGLIYPIFIREMMPGTVENVSNTVVCRLMPQKFPTMHKMNITITHHFIPLRLLFPNGYEEFFATPIPNADTPVWPYFADIEVDVGSLSDYLGLPTKQVYSSSGIRDQYDKIDKVNAEYHAAYQKVYNDWYRDQNLVNGGEPYPDTLVEGVNPFVDFNQLRRRAWQHDYFTACLPFAQKGDPVEVPIAAFDDVPVYSHQPNIPSTSGISFADSSTVPTATAAGLDFLGVRLDPETPATADQTPGRLYADTSQLSNSSTITINALRWANKLQEFLERNARGGTRYIELVRAHFGVRSSDARLQRSEFLGWSNTPIIISEVLSTANSTNPDGDLIGVTGGMYGHGIGVGKTDRTKYYAEEHGIFLSLLSIRPKTGYSQGIPRRFSRFRALDWPWPEFAHLGEQEVLNRELYYTDSDALNDDTFGYMQRYAEMKYENDRVAGQMRTTMADWHMSRIFDFRPHLNQAFIECTPTNRIFNVTSEVDDQYVLMITNTDISRQILPKQGIPSL